MIKLHVTDKYAANCGPIKLIPVYINPLVIAVIREWEVPQSINIRGEFGKERGSLVCTLAPDNDQCLSIMVAETPEQIVSMWK